MPTTCIANPGGDDGHTHDVAAIDLLTGNGWTAPGGTDGHVHTISSWTATVPPAPATPHTHHVTCPYSDVSGGGGGVGCGY